MSGSPQNKNFVPSRLVNEGVAYILSSFLSLVISFSSSTSRLSHRKKVS